MAQIGISSSCDSVLVTFCAEGSLVFRPFAATGAPEPGSDDGGGDYASGLRRQSTVPAPGMRAAIATYMGIFCLVDRGSERVAVP